MTTWHLLQKFNTGSIFEINITYHFNKLKKTHEITSTDTKLTFDKIHDKNSEKQEQKLQLIKGI